MGDSTPHLPELEGYDLVDVIGRGGMGVVYEAYQRSTGRRVAVKFMLDSSLASETARRRFEREVELVARLQHPHIVTIIDSGLQRGRYYYVMEYVEGVTLEEWERSDIDAVLKLMAAIGDAVDHAHQRGVLHRDLKPSNILVDAAAQPHLLDFGLAKFLASEVPDERGATLSEPGQMIGTLGYMPPEQLRAAADAISVRSDVYSLGAIAYELLAGRPPVRVDGPLDEVFERILLHDPAPPSSVMARHESGSSSWQNRRSARSWARSVRLADVDAVVMKALEKSPQRRYASARELSDDFQRCLSGEMVSARRAGTLTRMVRWTQRHRGITATAAGAAVIILAVASVSFVRVTRERDRAEVSVRQLAAKVDEISRILAFTQSMIHRTTEESAHERDIKPLLAMLADAEARAPRELAGHPEAETALRLSIGETYEKLGRLEEAERNYRQTLALNRQRQTERSAETMTSLMHLAGVRAMRGDPADAVKLSEQAVAIGQGVHGDGTLGMLAPLNNLAHMLHAAGEFERAERVMRDQLELQRRLQPEDHAAMAARLNSLAGLRMDRGDSNDAEQLYREALETYRPVAPDGDQMTVMIQNNLAIIVSTRDLGEAERMLRASLAIQRRELGDADPSVMGTRNLMGNMLLAAGRYPDAAQVYRETLAAHERAGRPEDEPLSFALSNLGAILFFEGQYGEAYAQFKRSATILARVHKNPTADDAIMQTNVAGALESLGRFEEAESECREALEMFQGLAVPRNRNKAAAISTMALIHHDRGDDEQAAELYGQALQILKREPEEGGGDAATPLVGLGQVRAAQGNLAEAERLYRDALTRLRRYLGEDHPDVGVALVRLASALRDQGRLQEAEALYHDGLATLRKRLDTEHPSVALVWYEWGDLHRRQGDLARARTLWQDALRIRTKQLPPGHPDIQAVRTAMARYATAQSPDK